MKAKEAHFLEFLKKSTQFVTPIYQRTYSWTERECRQIWDDIMRTGRTNTTSAHFIGPIVYIEKGLYQVSGLSSLLVIDGQQRLTTVTLILEALARRLGNGEPVEGFSAKKLRGYYLLNDLEDGDARFKLLLTQTDKTSLLALIQQKNQPADYSLRVTENFDFFDKQIRNLSTDDLVVLCKGLAKLIIVDVALSRDQDNPQLIFESMNSTGRELSQADLIRNFILMGVEPNEQTRLYEDHWRPMELDFGQSAYGEHFDGFMRYYLTLKTGNLPNVRAVYRVFKEHALTPEVAVKGIPALVADIQVFAGYYCAMALDKEPDRALNRAFSSLRELKANVTYPFLLELYDDYKKGILPQPDFHEAVRLVEAYVFRRAVCSIPTNSLNKTFATFGRFLQKDRYLESIHAHLLILPSYRRFPRDDEFKRQLCVRDLYNFPRRSYWLRCLEKHDRKEQVEVDEYTIEHILPQNENMSEEWRNELGPEWERVRKTWLNTLGNLTLTGYNPEYSDHPFAQKRDMKGGFRESPLKLNQGMGEVKQWNEDAIKARAERLARIAVCVWAAPSLPDEVVKSYRPKGEQIVGYTIEDHSDNLSPESPMRDLFDAFRKEVLALDPCVTEEFLKLYIAYKAETNFVDVVPQKHRLVLFLNIQFHELHDSRGLAKDVTNRGHWGNGDIECSLEGAEDIPYVMGLVRQAFEKQSESEE